MHTDQKAIRFSSILSHVDCSGTVYTGCPPLKVHTSLRKGLLPCTSCSHGMAAELVFTKADHFRELQVHAWRAVAKSSVMSSHLTFLHPHLYRLFLFLFLLYLQFLNSLLQGPPQGPLLISSTWGEFALILSCPSFPSSIRTWTQFNLDPFPGGSEDKASACNAGDPGSIPALGRSPGEGNDKPLQYSCLENPMDRGA